MLSLEQHDTVTNELNMLDAVQHKLDVIYNQHCCSDNSYISAKMCSLCSKNKRLPTFEPLLFWLHLIMTSRSYYTKLLEGQLFSLPVHTEVANKSTTINLIATHNHTNDGKPFTCGINLTSIVTASIKLYTHSLLRSRHPTIHEWK